jgi:glutathione-regulated potassium-efflux system ancillary protein KefG
MKVYCAEGTNNYPVYEFLKPFEQTARLCGMEYMPPFTVMGTHRLTPTELEEHVDLYEMAIDTLKNGVDLSAVRKHRFLNDYLQTLKTTAK